ncbi:enoyl-CoA hydratase/isomerase family protein [Pseudoalteromonas xiamenensis]|uniref:enoyl-CoA hydratase/isomerase family protein n=1 Tax=Pseudoalteromonas xiamenensis TaxID=882626 RepID=UPI0027E59A80|nr:enoyl-CoA hydratase/isomerase family protein [Pseudoalteromonas xiamenensis]WMN60128.1 enoyl-CoA hydratase/isomerase family protein [Pseudoalteromonas xiamenensis]
MSELNPLNDLEAPVVFEEAVAANGMKIAFATLNVPKTLNALNLEMIRLLAPQLKAWEQQEDIALVVLKGSGEKAFCAGGDVVSLYKAMASGDEAGYIETFFSEEYALDYHIHCYEKPILLWGNGIIMGGGLGLMAGASHRVVTETSRIAMPEITIGLYPDVGGSYFLNKMPAGAGLFLGLTGASINAGDAKFVGLADYFVDAQRFNELVSILLETNFGKTVALNHEKLSSVLQKLDNASAAAPKSAVKSLAVELEKLESLNTIGAQVEFISSLDSTENKWLSKAQASLKHGSPLSAVVISEQIKRTKGLSLKACFLQELSISVTCGKFGEFQEGVRALLIDKDNSPNWRFKNINDVDLSVVEQFFQDHWADGNHPLAGL